MTNPCLPVMQDWRTIIAACRQVPTLWNGSPALVLARPPAKRQAIAAAEAQIGGFPPEHRALLVHSDGLHLVPWDSEGSGGIMLCGVTETLRWTEGACAVQGVPGGDLPFAIVGWTVGEGCYLGAAQEGAIYVLEPLYTSDLWLRGEGSLRLADSLQGFVLELAHHRGRWWWQGGRRNGRGTGW